MSGAPTTPQHVHGSKGLEVVSGKGKRWPHGPGVVARSTAVDGHVPGSLGHCLPSFWLFSELTPYLLWASFISFSYLAAVLHLNVPVLRSVVPTWGHGMRDPARH